MQYTWKIPMDWFEFSQQIFLNNDLYIFLNRSHFNFIFSKELAIEWLYFPDPKTSLSIPKMFAAQFVPWSYIYFSLYILCENNAATNGVLPYLDFATQQRTSITTTYVHGDWRVDACVKGSPGRCFTRQVEKSKNSQQTYQWILLQK